MEHRGVLRVNGELAVTRTIGNRRLSRDGVLSSEPDVVFVSHRGGDSDSRHEAGGEMGGIPAFGREGGERSGGRSTGSSGSSGSSAAFLVLASDGLWDVVSSQEAIEMVKEVILGASQSAGEKWATVKSPAAAGGGGAGVFWAGGDRDEDVARGKVARGYGGSYGAGQAFQVAATALTHEAYVRGSTDNIGVCVVDLRHHR